MGSAGSRRDASNQSRAAKAVVREKLDHACRKRLTEEATKLDSKEERVLAEEEFVAELETWPAY